MTFILIGADPYDTNLLMNLRSEGGEIELIRTCDTALLFCQYCSASGGHAYRPKTHNIYYKNENTLQL